MNKELRELLAQLDAKEKEMSELKTKGDIRAAHSLLAEIEELEQKIEVTKKEEKRSKEMAIELAKKEEKKELNKENRAEVFASQEYRTAFIKSLVKQPLTQEETRLIGLGTGNGSVMVPTTIHETVIKKLNAIQGIRSVVRKLSSSTNLSIVLENGVATASYALENAVGTESSPTMTNVTLSAYKLSALVKISNELLQDAIFDIESMIVDQIVNAIAVTEGAALFNGNGTSQPEGFKTKVEANTLVQTGATGKGGKIQVTDIFALMGKLDPKLMPNAKFLMNNSTFWDIMGLLDSTGRPIVQVDLRDGVTYKILGHDVVIDSNVANAGLGATSVYFGDFERMYTIVDRSTTSIKVLDQTFAANDLTGILATFRSDGKVVDANAVVSFKGGAS